MKRWALILMSLLACQRRERADDEHTIRIAMSAEPPSLNPQLDPLDARGRDIAYYVYESLAQPDPVSGALKPRLAERWEVSADGLTFTFHLRHDVRWHDGEPFTAADVVFTFDKLRDPATHATGIRSFLTPLVSVRADGQHTVIFTTSTPYWYALDALSEIYIYPAHVYASVDFNTAPANRAPIGTGRYKLISWTTGDRIVLHRNEDYYGKHAHMVSLAFIYVPEPAMRLQMARAGELDVIERIQPEQWVAAAHDTAITDKLELLKHVPDGVQWIGWNEARPMFADARVRRAMTMLIDRQDIVRSLRFGLDTVAASWFYPGSPDYDTSIAPLPYDPATATALLSEAGWSDHNHDGTLDKDGTPFEFTFVYPTNNPLYEQLASAMAGDFAKAHIRMTTAKVEWSIYTERLRKHDFDACSLVWRLEPHSDPFAQFHSTGGSNWFGFANPEADTLLSEARAQLDTQKRTVLYHRFSELLAREQPITLLFNRYNLSLVSNRFSGVTSTPYGLFRYEDFAVR